MPDPRSILDSRPLRIFGTLLHDPNLWHLNRRSAARAFAIGLFMMWMPPFGQSVMAAAAAILWRANLPISVVLVFITNPVTIPPMFYGAFVIGCLVLGHPVPPFDLDFWLNYHNWLGVLGPLAVGCLICAIISSIGGWLAIHALWRWSLVRQIRRRRERIAALLAARKRLPGK